MNLALDVYDFENHQKGLKTAVVYFSESNSKTFLYIDTTDILFVGYDLDNNSFVQIPPSQIEKIEIKFETEITDNDKTIHSNKLEDETTVD